MIDVTLEPRRISKPCLGTETKPRSCPRCARVAQAQGVVARIARKAHLTREATYKMFSKSGNPELRSLSAVLKATGLRIAAKPIEKQAA